MSLHRKTDLDGVDRQLHALPAAAEVVAQRVQQEEVVPGGLEVLAVLQWAEWTQTKGCTGENEMIDMITAF